MRLHVSCFNLTELLAFFEKEFMIMAEEKAINLQFCPEVEELMVWGDKELWYVTYSRMLLSLLPPGVQLGLFPV